MPSCLTAPVLDERFPLPGAVPVAPLEVTEGDRESLLTALGRVPDPRDPRGVRYPIVAMLTVVVCAMLAGARSYAAIGEWCADLDATDRRDLGFTGKVPGPVTIWSLLVRVDAVALDEVVCAWIRACLTRVNAAARARSPDRRPVRRVLAVDGKALHAQVRHLDYLHARGAHLLVCVKGNQPTLRSRLRALPWTDVPVGHTQTGTSVHGRARSLLR